MLDLDAEPLSAADGDRGLFVVDATWRYAARMVKSLGDRPEMVRRSIPGGYRTAYPRCQTDCPDPDRGLASVEAIAVAYRIMGRGGEDILDHYYWKEGFLERNAALWQQ